MIFSIITYSLTAATFSLNLFPTSIRCYSGAITTIYNSTFYDNSSSKGAATSTDNCAQLNIYNSTFYANTGSHTLQNYNGNSTLNVYNSIIANTITGIDCIGGLNTKINTLIEDGSCGSTPSGAPLLSNLADNGGDTQTMALQIGSQAINAGDNGTCEATDQRGETRPKYTTCDIGAYEYNLKAPTSLTGIAASQTQINLSWTDNSDNETGFKIERAGSLITTTAANATSYNDGSLSCDTSYSYSVKATDGNFDSTAITVSTTTQACPSLAVTEPTPTYELSINQIGNGSLALNDSLCSNNDSQCTRYYGEETVTITVTPDSNWLFTGFSGDCSSATVLMDSDKSCTAIFKQQHSLTISVKGQGTVNDCGTSCIQTHPEDETIKLTITSAKGWALDNWTGDCDKNGTVTMDSDKTCTANFVVGLDDDNDHDNISNEIEDGSPNNGDGNNDGIKDSQQIEVVSFQDSVSGGYITLEVSKDCPIDNVYADTSKNLDFDDSFIFPQGIVYFDLKCTETDVKFFYHGLGYIFKPSFMKFGATVPGDLSTIDWYTMSNVTFGTGSIGGKTVVTAKYHLKDGELGDNTGVDGRIVDPGGICIMKFFDSLTILY